MGLEELKVFLAVAELGSFTRASIQVGVSQSGVSRGVQRLEEEFRTRLLYRNGRGVTLTEAGVRVKTMAEQIFQSLDSVREELSAPSVSLSGSIVVGLPPSLGASISAPLARRFQSAHPAARLRIVEAFSGTLLEWLEGARVDLAVLYDARRSATILATPLLLEDLYLVGRPTPSRPAGPVTIEALAEGPFALSGSANGMRRVIDSAAAKAGVALDVSVEVDSVAALIQLVLEGPERSVLPFGAVHAKVSEGRLEARRLDGAALQPLLVTATPLNRPVTKIMDVTTHLLIAQISDCLKAGVITGKLLQPPPA